MPTNTAPAGCAAVLRRRRTDPHDRALAMAITGLLLFVLASQMPFIELRIGTALAGLPMAAVVSLLVGQVADLSWLTMQ